MPGTMAHASPSVERCIVCFAKKKDNKTYFRVDMCRACAVFFRRASKSTTPFLCRSNTGNCRIERGRIYACAKCRFKRIRKIIFGKLERVDHLENVKHSLAHDKIAKNVPKNALDSDYEIIPDSEIYFHYLDEFRPMSVSPSLRRFTQCYNDLCRQRLIIDFGSLNDLPFNAKGKIEAPATYATCASPTSLRQVKEAIRSFLTAASDEFAVMRPECQSRLLGNFMKHFIPFECFYRFYVSFGRYLDMDKVADFYEDSLCDNIFKDEALKILHEGTRKNSAILAPAMEKLRLSDEEFIGITAVLTWNVGHNTDSEALCEIVAKKKTAALHDLYMHYKSIGITNYASRLGEIFMFLTLMENITDESATIMKKLALLGVFDEEFTNLLDDPHFYEPS